MKAKRRVILTVLVGSMAIGTGGCGLFELFTLLGAVAKFAQGTVGDLTAAEWEVVSKTAADAAGDPRLKLSTNEAQAIVNFLDQNNITSMDQFQTIGDQQDLKGLEDLGKAFQDRFPNTDFNDPQATEEALRQYAEDLGDGLRQIAADFGFTVPSPGGGP